MKTEHRAISPVASRLALSANAHGDETLVTYCILIVEDEALIGLDLASALEEEGFKTAGIARDMSTALRLAAKGGIDLATMDVQLANNTNGVDTSIELRNLHSIPCVFVSGSLDPETRARAAAARPLGFLSKPIGSDAVARFVKRYFESM